jgi:uncharacterized protein (TIGR02284 family)
MTATQSTVETLNTLLRGELAATETYQQALEKISEEPGASDLRTMHVEHREAANTLRQHVRNLGGLPDTGSGPWGAFAKAVEGTAKLFGNVTALKALKEGEEHGVKEYRDALEQDLPSECRMLIVSKLLSQTERHVQTLDRLIEIQ